MIRLWVCLCGTHRMSMADSGNILTGGSILHGQSSFIDHLSCPLEEKSLSVCLSHCEKMKCHRLKVILSYNWHHFHLKVLRHRFCINNFQEMPKKFWFLQNAMEQKVPYKIHSIFLLMCASVKLTEPTMWAPSILSVSLWLRIFTMPSVSELVLARLLAAKGNLPTL